MQETLTTRKCLQYMIWQLSFIYQEQETLSAPGVWRETYSDSDVVFSRRYPLRLLAWPRKYRVSFSHCVLWCVRRREDWAMFRNTVSLIGLWFAWAAMLICIWRSGDEADEFIPPACIIHASNIEGFYVAGASIFRGLSSTLPLASGVTKLKGHPIFSPLPIVDAAKI